MKKIFILPAILSVLIMWVIYLNTSFLNPYNTVFFHPLFATLLPLTCLLFLSNFLKNIQPKVVFMTIAVFCIIEFLVLSQIDPICSQIACFDRNMVALTSSSLFSIVYFIILFTNNKKQSTLVK